MLAKDKQWFLTVLATTTDQSIIFDVLAKQSTLKAESCIYG